MDSLGAVNSFAAAITDLYGDTGRQWLRDLPALRATVAERWSLRIGDPFPLSYNWVAPATAADGTPVVVKLSPAANPELPTETAALRLADGRGAIRLLHADLSLGVRILERAVPGHTLASLARRDDRAATSAAAAVMRRFRRPAPADHPFPTVAGWRLGFTRLRDAHDGGTGPLPAAAVEQAERAYDELLATADDPVVLHADLHHDNILAADREPWLAIDPKGLVGEPAYEAGALLRNPHPDLLDEPDPRRTLARRLDQLADELELDRDRLRRWAFAQAVLSAVWGWEDHGAPSPFALRCAELLGTL